MDMTEKTIASKEIFDGRVLHMFHDTVALSDGTTSLREIVRHPGGVCIAALDGEKYKEPTADLRIECAKEHLRLLVHLKGERTGVLEGRRHTAYYTKGMYGSAILRQRLNSAVKAAEITDILDELKRMYENDGTST